MIDTLWSEWAEVRVLLAIGASNGADPVFTLDDPTYGQLDVGVLGSPLAPYVDVTCDVRAIDYGWGATRNDGVLTRWEAASGSLVLDNNEGAYDVGTDDSPLVPMIGVLVQARLVGSSSWVTRFAGFANAFAAGWDAGSLDATTTISATDATGLLAAYVMQPTSPLVGAGDTSSQRVGRILDAAEWTGARDLDSGGRVLAATDLSGDAWSQLLAVDDAELGAVYIAPDGTATFRTREHVWGQITATSAPSVTFGPGVGQLRYEDATVSSDDALLRNIVDAQRPGGALVSVRDAASVSRFRPHRYANTGLALASDSDVQSWASMVLNVSSAPFSRVDALVVIPRTDPAHLFPVVLGAQYLDRWHVVVDPPGNADEIERDVLVRGWHTTIDRTDWQTTYALSSLAGFDAFILDDPDTMLDVVRLTAWGHAMPWKQWAYLERVTSPDFQSYLQNQTVPQFVNVAQRDSVWTPVPPPKGATCVTQDTLTRWIWDGAQWVAATQPRGIVASGIAGQPAVNGLLNLSTVVAGPASWLAGHTVTLPAGSAGLYLISLVAYFRSSAIVGMRLEITNSAAASYAPNMLVAESTNPSTWDPNTMAGAWVRPCGDGDTFRVTNRGNAETAPDYVQTARLSIVRLGDSLAPY